MTNKSELLAEIARSRAAVARDADFVRQELDVTSQLKSSVKRRPFAWLGGAAALGYMLAGPKTRAKTIVKTVRESKAATSGVKKTKSHTFLEILVGLFKFLLPMVRPLISAYAARHIGALAEKLGR